MKRSAAAAKTQSSQRGFFGIKHQKINVAILGGLGVFAVAAALVAAPVSSSLEKRKLQGRPDSL
jgi:hypothetical protein